MKEWPNTIYDVGAVTVAVQSELKRVSASSAEARILMECLAEMLVAYFCPEWDTDGS